MSDPTLVTSQTSPVPSTSSSGGIGEFAAQSWNTVKSYVGAKLKEEPIVQSFKNLNPNYHPHPEIDAANKKKHDFDLAHPVTITGYHKTLADYASAGYDGDKKFQAYMEARNLKDPNKAPTPQLKMTAVAGKLSRIITSPAYSSLRVENKIRVLGSYYDRYVAPAMKVNGIEPPSKEEWLAGYTNQARKEKDSEWKPRPTNTEEVLYGISMGTAETSKLVSNIIRYTIGDQTHLGDFIRSKSPGSAKNIDAAVAKIKDFATNVDHVSQDFNSSFATRHDPAAWLSNMAGHMVGEAPAYLTAGKLLGPVFGILDSAGGVVPSLAEKGALSTGMKVATTALKNAGEVFSVDKVEGKSTGAAAKDAAFAAAFSPVIHGAFAALGKIVGADARLSISNQLRYAASKLGVGGEPFANKVAQVTDKSEAELHPEYAMTDSDRNPHKPVALVNEADPDFKLAVKHEAALREALAKEFHPEKAEASGGRSVWRNLSTTQRAKIKTHIASLSKSAAEVMPIVAPEIQTTANAQELSSFAAMNPSFAARMQRIEKATGLKVAEVLTNSQAGEAASKNGINTPAQKLETSFKSEPNEVAFEPREGASASLSPGYQVSYLRNNPRLTNAQLINPKLSTLDFIDGTLKYLEDSPNTKSGKIYFEHPAHHLLQVAENSKAPAPIKARAFRLLGKEFDINKADAQKYAGWLDYHVNKLKDSGRFDVGREGNVFRSTKLSPARYGTKWQKQLVPEIIANEAQATDKLLKKLDPKVAASTRALSKQLTNLAERSQTSARALDRRQVRKNIHTDLSELQ